MYYFPILNNKKLQIHQLSLKKHMSVHHSSYRLEKEEQFLFYKDQDGNPFKYPLYGEEGLPLSIVYSLSRSNYSYYLRGAYMDSIIPTPPIIYEKNIYTLLTNRFYYEMIYQMANPNDIDLVLDLRNLTHYDEAILSYLEELNVKQYPLSKRTPYIEEDVMTDDGIDNQHFSLLRLLDSNKVEEYPVFDVYAPDRDNKMICLDPKWASFVDLAISNDVMLGELEKKFHNDNKLLLSKNGR